MYKKISLISFVALFSLVIFGTGTLTTYAKNIIANGSFDELNDSGFPSGWLTNFFEEKVDLSVDDEIVADGNYSMRITGTFDPEHRSGPRGGVRQAFDVSKDPAGTRYRLRGLYRTEGVVKSDALRIRFYFNDVVNQAIRGLSDDPHFRVISTKNATHQFVSDAHFHIHPIELAEDEWKEFDTTFIAPFGTVRMFFSMWIWHGTGTIWWDDVSLERVTE